ncbi:MAG: LbtU family siderophore porin [Coxiellaceae bacterium]|nr:LbtU family siderophore porin [Coxiellaceae bacterium]
MKLSLKAAAALAVTVGATTAAAQGFAASRMSEAQLATELQKVSAQTAALQKQVRSLRAQLKHVKKAHKVAAHPVPNGHTNVSKKSDKHAEKHPGLLQYMNGVTVSTSPILGLRSKYDASDLITNLPTMNEDLRLLSQRAHLENIAQQHGFTYAEKPFLILSGRVEGQAIIGGNFDGSPGSDIDLSAAELDIEPIVSRYAAGFMSILYDGSPPITGFRERVSNSRIFLRRGFLTIGDLNALPLYFTIGQMYMPFGRYSSAMVTAPMTLSIGRTLERAALLGFEKSGVYSEAYGFRGDTRISGNATVNEGGFNLGVKRPYSRGTFDVGAGIISNLGDSSGMQETGFGNSNAFQGFGVSTSAERLDHRVPAVNGHIELGVNNWNLLAEYVGATRRFATGDLTYNGLGASPKAMHYELIYNFPISGKPSNLGIMYGESWQALGLNLPKKSYAIAFNTSLWKDTLQAIEYRHDINYGQNDTSFGRNASAGGFATQSVYLGGRHSRNLVTAQIGVYF